jgi:hypothetical protein
MRTATFAIPLALLTGCATLWQTAELNATHVLDQPPRSHSWAFASAEVGAELELVRAEIRQRLAAACWLEAPVDQAELWVEPKLALGPPRWVDGANPFFAVLELLGLVTSIAAREQPPEPHDPEYVEVWSTSLQIQVLRPDDGQVAWEGRADSAGEPHAPPTLAAALARALLTPFPGKPAASWTASLPPYPARPLTAPTTRAPAAAPLLPPRTPCTEAVPVVAFSKARFWDAPNPKDRIAFRLEAVTSGCASHAAGGLLLVALADGRRGYVSSSSVLYHPGP